MQKRSYIVESLSREFKHFQLESEDSLVEYSKYVPDRSDIFLGRFQTRENNHIFPVKKSQHIAYKNQADVYCSIKRYRGLFLEQRALFSIYVIYNRS